MSKKSKPGRMLGARLDEPLMLKARGAIRFYYAGKVKAFLVEAIELLLEDLESRELTLWDPEKREAIHKPAGQPIPEWDGTFPGGRPSKD